ncbi:DNA repair protein RecN [Kytococcus schroeteri]|uniref:DNA repair protein RecN n=1 Tax=Kytococcus schroeteri TaxID=138300 RepID=UPI001143A839|nr:DNA repair protein RecN [Kytococcus schroeteri]
MSTTSQDDAVTQAHGTGNEPWLSTVEIRNLGVIHDATVELDRGLTVVTGETGAGKTMMVQSLSLLLGRRAESGWVRHGAEAAVVTGVYEVPGGAERSDAVQAVEGAGGFVEDGELLVTRRVTTAGRSAASVGGARVPVRTLSGVSERLVAIHGQADQWRLLSADAHREVLDAFGGAPVVERLEAYRVARDEVVRLDRALRDFDAERTLRSQRAAWLRKGLDLLETVKPEPGEEQELRERVARLDHAADLVEAGHVAAGALSGDPTDTMPEPGAVELVGQAREAMERVAHVDAEVGELHGRLRELGVLAQELAADLSSWVGGLDLDPGELQVLHERRAALRSLAQEFGRPELLPAGHPLLDPQVEVEGLEGASGAGGALVEGEGAAVAPSADIALAWGELAAQELDGLGTSDEDRERLAGELEEARTTARVAADALTALRRQVASDLGERVTAEVRALAMPKAEVTVAVEGARPGPHGADAVEIRMAPNPGVPARTVAKAASGGELSRLMLALEVVVGDAEGGVPTMVFDEVDAGVGGEAAHAIGARLARIAAERQVIVVTHLPQVAAYADRHLVIAKSDDGAVTTSDVAPVEGEARLAELARMLGGVSESRSAREHAAELVEAARERRGS